MFAEALVDIGMMLLSAVLGTAIRSVMMMTVITGAIPVLAIAMVCAIEGGGMRRRVWPDVTPGSELRNLARRQRAVRLRFLRFPT